MRVNLIIYTAVGFAIFVIVIVVFFLRKFCTGNRPESITLTNFDVNPHQPIIEESTLSEEEKEFDDLVENYKQARQAAEDRESTNGE